VDGDPKPAWDEVWRPHGEILLVPAGEPQFPIVRLAESEQFGRAVFPDRSAGPLRTAFTILEKQLLGFRLLVFGRQPGLTGKNEP
jgi:hypothetical protein